MKATRRRAIKFNLGNFEMFEVEAGIEYDTDELTDGEVDELLNDMLKDDVNMAELASTQDPEHNDTSVYKMNEIIGGK